ncbi:hypothetical protein ACIQC0_10140 [Pseudarthrobacter sp. NPDC092419]|uniref:hypothetical protein n=1 Tax=Pseudarthrobacter sp. NPDC092419 TaxID=3364414 RepID=UPI003828D3DE
MDRVSPGTEINRRIQVRNNTGARQSLHLYPGAARIQDGSFIGEDAGTGNELSSWVSLETPRIALGSGESAEVRTTIRVPRNAAEAEHYGAVWAELRSANPDARAGSVTTVNRVGIRVYLSVGPGNGKPADFAIGSLTAVRGVDGKPRLSALVTNTGGRALDLQGSLTLADGPGALSAGPFDTKKASTLATGERREVVFELPAEIPNGPWTAEVRLKSGLLERVASARITFPDEGENAASVPVPGSGGLLFILGALSIFVLALLLAILIRRHRRTSRVP